MHEDDLDAAHDNDDTVIKSSASFESDIAASSSADDPSNILRFVNEWLGSIFDAIVGLLLSQVSDIAMLSLAGSAQLLTDLEYLRYATMIRR